MVKYKEFSLYFTCCRPNIGKYWGPLGRRPPQHKRNTKVNIIMGKYIEFSVYFVFFCIPSPGKKKVMRVPLVVMHNSLPCFDSVINAFASTKA